MPASQHLRGSVHVAQVRWLPLLWRRIRGLPQRRRGQGLIGICHCGDQPAGLPDLAEAEFGAGFDLRAIHDRELGYGSLTLPMPDASVRDWIAGQR